MVYFLVLALLPPYRLGIIGFHDAMVNNVAGGLVPGDDLIFLGFYIILIYGLCTVDDYCLQIFSPHANNS
jgi:hypothetical protein